VASEGIEPVAAVDCAQSSTQTVTPIGMPVSTTCSLVPVSAGPAVPVTAISSPLSVLYTVPGTFWPVLPATLNAVAKFSVKVTDPTWVKAVGPHSGKAKPTAEVEVVNPYDTKPTSFTGFSICMDVLLLDVTNANTGVKLFAPTLVASMRILVMR
jgi:hypothetical protein